MAKKSLGRGMDALFSDSLMDQKLDNTATVLDLSIDLIDPNPEQPRKFFSQDTLTELAESIKEQGVIQPIIVEKAAERYIIIAGERRYRASKLANKTSIPALVRSFSEEEKLEIALIENIQREDLSPIEEALAYKSIMDLMDLSQEALAHKVGKKRSTITNSLRLLKLPLEMRDAVDNGTLSPGHARAILSLVNPSDQKVLFSKILMDGLSVREAEALALKYNRGDKSSTPPKEKNSLKQPLQHDLDLLDFEQKMIEAFGTRVSIQGTARKGKIQIHYYSLDDLERIYDIIQK